MNAIKPRVAAFLLASAVLPGGTGRQPAAIPPDSRWEAEIRAFEAADRAHAPAPGAVLFLGSSSIRMWTGLAADFPSTSVIARGFGGSTIADSIRYFDRIVLPCRPRLIVLYAGDNDLAEGKTPEQVFSDFRDFVGLARERLPRVRIAFISIKPSPARRHLLDRIRTANSEIRGFTTANPALLFVDVCTPMLDPDGEPRGELFGPDGLHMSRAGYELWRWILAPVLEQP